MIDIIKAIVSFVVVVIIVAIILLGVPFFKWVGHNIEVAEQQEQAHYQSIRSSILTNEQLAIQGKVCTDAGLGVKLGKDYDGSDWVVTSLTCSEPPQQRALEQTSNDMSVGEGVVGGAAILGATYLIGSLLSQ